MRKFSLLAFVCVVVSLSVAGQNAFWSNNGLVSVKAAAYISIIGDAYNQGNGIYDNSDSIFVTGNWTHNAPNRCFDSIGLGWVYFYAADQHINGSSKTHFNNLVLKNQGVKYGDIDVYVDDSLFLNNREFHMDTNTVWVLNPDTGAVKRTSGYVSSLQDGGLLRRTNSMLSYLFAVGSNVGAFRYRPVEFQPVGTNQNHFKARFANVDPTAENFDRNIKAPTVCQINPAWYHRLYHISGTDSAAITIMYDTVADGSWVDIVHWQNLPEWESIIRDTVIAGTPFNRISKFVWNDFTYSPFALAKTSLITVQANIKNVTCYGFGNGAINLIVKGVRVQDTLVWSNADTTQNISGLVPGVYTVSISQYAGCLFQDSFRITQPTPLADTINAHNAICFGSATGSALVVVSGATPPYNVLWSDSATTPAITPITAGTYTVVVTDSNGCLKKDSILITQPTILSTAINALNAICFGSATGSAVVNISGATPPYSVMWSDSATTPAISPITAGKYFVIVTDSNGCHKTDSVLITQPTALATAMSAVNNVCYGQSLGAASVAISGAVPPYKVVWNNAETSPAISKLAAGLYTVIVTDSNGCTKNDSVQVSQPTQLTTSMISSADSCYGSSNGSATVQIKGATPPYTVFWNDSATTTTVTHIAAGTYSVIVIDSNGCKKTDSVLVTQPARDPFVVAGVDTMIWRHDTIQLNGFNGIAYQWAPNYNLSCTDCHNPLAWPDSDIVYHLSVGDNKGCFYTDTVRIFVRDKPFVFFFIPNAITPNGDGYNDTWFIKDLERYPDNEVRIINRWGDEVFFQAPYQNDWAGTWNGQNLPGETYYYILKINYNGQQQKFDGPLTIVR